MRILLRFPRVVVLLEGQIFISCRGLVVVVRNVSFSRLQQRLSSCAHVWNDAHGFLSFLVLPVAGRPFLAAPTGFVFPVAIGRPRRAAPTCRTGFVLAGISN